MKNYTEHFCKQRGLYKAVAAIRRSNLGMLAKPIFTVVEVLFELLCLCPLCAAQRFVPSTSAVGLRVSGRIGHELAPKLVQEFSRTILGRFHWLVSTNQRNDSFVLIGQRIPASFVSDPF